MLARSVVARLMVPVAIMLVLVCLLGAVSFASRSRLRSAYDELRACEQIRYKLADMRSLSRSLQRDALNIVSETDPVELRTLHGKFASRTQAMQAGLTELGHSLSFTALEAPDYLRTQWIVLSRLKRVAAVADRGDRRRAYTLFRQEVRPNERAASHTADRLIAAREAEVHRLYRRTELLEQQEVMIRTAASALLLLAAAALALLLILRTVVRPLSDIERALGRVAEGDTASRIPHIDRLDEIGRMARAIEVFRVATLDRERLRAENERVNADAMRHELDRQSAERRAEQDEADRNRAIARAVAVLEQRVAQVLERLRTAAVQLTQTAVELSSHSSSAARGVEEVKSAAARAVDGAADIAAATGQFMNTLDDASGRTQHTAQLSEDLARHSIELSTRMARVRSDTQAVGAITDVIHGIARQTNLLALNAAIEAARVSGEGHGFAVVAGEVKALAEQTARATNEISGQIESMQRATTEATESLTVIERGIAAMASTSDTLASSFAEQVASGKVIGSNARSAADDLDSIRRRLTDLAGAADGVDGLATSVRSDASLLESSASTLDEALGTFFDGLRLGRPGA